MAKKDAVLVLGAGNSRKQTLRVKTADEPEPGMTFGENFRDIWTIDQDPASQPKILWDLETPTPGGDELSWPVPEHFFDEVHAYEVLEHLGGMGDFKFFFALWRKLWRVLKPGGLVCATTPWWESVWAWQDPGHRRVYSPELLGYLQQEKYEAEVGTTAMTDYRKFFPRPYNFVPRLAMMTKPEEPRVSGFAFILQKEGSFADPNESRPTIYS